MYIDNPAVNEELRQRLPSPTRQLHGNTTQQRGNITPQCSNATPHLSYSDRPGEVLPDHAEWPQAPLHQAFQEPLISRSPSPVSQRRSVSPLSQRRSVSPLSQRRSLSPLSQRRSPSPLSSRLPAAPRSMEVDAAPSRGPSPRAESCSDVADGGGVSRGPGSPVFRKNLASTDSGPHQEPMFGSNRTAKRVLSLDRDKNISFLLKELDSLRDLNQKLQAQLVQKEKELQRREVEELREEQQDARSWERGVLEDVLSAQKNRDQAVMSRLLLANEERDQALLRAQRLLQAAAQVENINVEESDMDVEELLQCVCGADSVQEVEQFGAVLVQRLRSAQQRRHDITAQEMKAVMEERDGSVSRCKRLEQDLVQEREQSTDKDELLRLQRERDSALEDRQRLEEELQTLRAYHSLHLPHPSSSLSSQGLQSSRPASVPRDGSSLLGTAQQQAPLVLQNSRGAGQPSMPGDGSSLQGTMQQQAPLVLQVEQLSREKQSVEAELQRSHEAQREARERVLRLERLVEVLRKKVGTGSVRAVI